MTVEQPRSESDITGAPEIKTVYFTFKAVFDHGIWLYSCPQKPWLKEISDDNSFQVTPEGGKVLPRVKKNGLFASINGGAEIVLTPKSVDRKGKDMAFGIVLAMDRTGEIKEYNSDLKEALSFPKREEQAAVVFVKGKQRVLFLFSIKDLKKPFCEQRIKSLVARS